jgi:PTS system nitrogen regulatory IIA component
MQLTVKEIARLTNVSEKKVREWIRNEELPAYVVNETYRCNRAELLEWATAHKIAVSPEIFRGEDRSEEPLPSLSEALEAGGIQHRVAGKDKTSVLKSVVKLLPLPENVEREFLLSALLTREALGSTGIGRGIAIPHVRNPIILNVKKLSVTLCFLEQPIDFGAPDGVPVRVLFVLISNTVRTHLHLLSKLAFVLSQEFVRQTLTQEVPASEIIKAFKKAEAETAPPPKKRS